MSLTKATIAHLRRLQEKKYRTQTGTFVIEGTKVVGELLAAGHSFVELYATDEWAAPQGLRTAIVRIAPEEMRRISHYSTASPVFAVGQIVQPETLDATDLENGYTLALDRVQDPGNVGTLVRIADWFGFDRVLLSLDCADLFSQKVINASMGSFARVRTHRVVLEKLLSQVKVPIYGCALHGESVHEIAPPISAIVVIGSEGRGLSAPVAECITRLVTIPRKGSADSLNAAVAGGIICAILRKTG